MVGSHDAALCHSGNHPAESGREGVEGSGNNSNGTRPEPVLPNTASQPHSQPVTTGTSIKRELVGVTTDPAKPRAAAVATR